ncbi:BBP7 family outer membrane beta-barrel protein [Botrimarina sp.]|uniref:BBP7 family outer membrane beta-barrel protein n=1 Tax=Botrimarina sp. TaxID=2795802 RepID=UPI0032EC7A8E
MPTRSQVALALTLSTLVAATGEAQRQGEDGSPMAILIRNPTASDGAPPFALADQYGRVQRLVEPTPGIDLARHVGQRVRIRHDTGRTLLASQIELPLADAGPRELQTVSPAQFVPPRALKRLPEPASQRPLPSDRTYPVTATQAAEEVAPGPANPIDLDALIDDDTRLAPTPADLPSNGEPLRGEPTVPENVPPGAYVGDGALVEPGYATDDDYYVDGYAGEPAHDCPRCRARRTAPLAKPSVCAECGVRPPVGCMNCGRAGGWCGPSCSPASKRGLYGRADYLLWWFDGMDTPPLATTNDQGAAPILGQPGTSVVYGGELLDDARNGLRLSAGAWLDDRRDVAVEGDWMLFENQGDDFRRSNPTGASILGRPFYNVAPVFGGVVQLPSDDAQLVSFPSQVGGSLAIASRSELQSAGLRLRTGICCREIGGVGDACGCPSCQADGGFLNPRTGRPTAISRIDFIAGYRWIELEERLSFNEQLIDLATTATVGVNERFDTENDFHGVDLGFIYEWQATRWGVELVSKIAVGGTRQRVAIAGSNTVGGAGVGVTTPGGLLAQASNIGVYEQDRFSVLPELSARVSYRVTPQLSLSAGYSLLYWANVVRPGDQIDFSVDGRLASGVLTTAGPFSHPRLDVEETSLWAHGLNFGAEYQY